MNVTELAKSFLAGLRGGFRIAPDDREYMSVDASLESASGSQQNKDEYLSDGKTIEDLQSDMARYAEFRVMPDIGSALPSGPFVSDTAYADAEWIFWQEFGKRMQSHFGDGVTIEEQSVAHGDKFFTVTQKDGGK